MVTARSHTLGAFALALLITAAPLAAAEDDLGRYREAVRDICRIGVTPEITAAWERARQAASRAPSGGGGASDFAGIKTPEGFWLDCFQSPGDGKT
jgi:hypothetical protein